MLSYSDLSEAWGNYPQEKNDNETSDKEHFNYEVKNNDHYICSCEKCYKKMENFFMSKINSQINKENFTQVNYIHQIKDFYNNNKNVQLLVIILLIIIIILLVKYLLTPKYKIQPYFYKNMYGGLHPIYSAPFNQ
jgi:hypothetical protein